MTIMTITARSICSVNSYCDNQREVIYAVLAVIVTIMTMTGGAKFSANSYCDNNDNNRQVYM